MDTAQSASESQTQPQNDNDGSEGGTTTDPNQCDPSTRGFASILRDREPKGSAVRRAGNKCVHCESTTCNCKNTENLYKAIEKK